MFALSCSQRLAVAVGLEGCDGHKLRESVWRIVIYSITWLWAAHLLFRGDKEYFFAMRTHYDCKNLTFMSLLLHNFSDNCNLVYLPSYN